MTITHFIIALNYSFVSNNDGKSLKDKLTFIDPVMFPCFFWTHLQSPICICSIRFLTSKIMKGSLRTHKTSILKRYLCHNTSLLRTPWAHKTYLGTPQLRAFALKIAMNFTSDIFQWPCTGTWPKTQIHRFICYSFIEIVGQIIKYHSILHRKITFTSLPNLFNPSVMWHTFVFA